MLDRNKLNLTPLHENGANPDDCNRCLYYRRKIMGSFKYVVFVLAALVIIAGMCSELPKLWN